MSDNAAKMPALFPATSKDGDTAALPAIWDNKADFDAKMAKFSADAKAAAGKVTNVETLKAEVGDVRKNCGGCHNDLPQEELIVVRNYSNRGRRVLRTRRPRAVLGSCDRHRIARGDTGCCANSFCSPLAVAIVALAAFWVLTIPGTVPASALGPHTPNLDNGKTMFFAGGCASCHATPGQDDKTRLGGGLGLKSPFGTFYVPNISPDNERRHRPVDRSAVRHRDGEGNLARRAALLSVRFPTRRTSA